MKSGFSLNRILVNRLPSPTGRVRGPSSLLDRRLALAALAVFCLTLPFAQAQSTPASDQPPSVSVGKAPPNSAESLVRRTLDLLKDLYKVLSDIKGRATAMEAVPKIRTIAGQMQELKTDADALGPLDPELSTQLQKKFEKEVQDVAEKLAAVLKKVTQNQVIWEEIAPAMQELPPSMLQGQN